jgi:hypothetical protein
MESMTEATEAFVKGADWLTPDDQAAVTAMRHAAAGLDDRFTASLLAQWRGLYNDLRSRKVQEPTEALDEQDQFLQRLG